MADAADPKKHKPFLRRFLKEGELGIWLCALALDLTILMALGLLALVLWNSVAFFWPQDLVQAVLRDGTVVLGVVWDEEEAEASGVRAQDRLQFKVGNRRMFGLDFRWVDVADIRARGKPPDAVAVERTEYGDLYGWLVELREDREVVASGDAAWQALLDRRAGVEEVLGKTDDLEDRMGEINREVERLRLDLREREMEGGAPAELREIQAGIEAKEAAFEQLRLRLEDLLVQASSAEAVMRLTSGQDVRLPLMDIVRIYKPNRMGVLSKLGLYLAKWWEFLTGEPRESNTEGGIFPALFGTFFLVIVMSIAAVPLGVVAALYLAEYAREGLLVRAVRIAVQNLAGVPSIVFGVFGLGFFIYGVGGLIDRVFFAERLPTPTFGTGGVLWASLTLALLTVPVVIVATEEALRAVPQSVREASYGLGATRWQTVRRVVLPAALPGILTGLILAVARGAGEVAPLMITGVVKLAPALPVDGSWPFVHLDRKFMHLAFHIYDVGFQSPNVEAAKPMVYQTTLLLLALVVVLNLIAIRVRNRLRDKYRSSAV